MLVIDQRVLHVLAPVVGVFVLEAARIEAAEGIMREEQRPAEIGTERQFEIVIAPPVVKARPCAQAL